jgi:hypothetical protein
MAMDLRFSVIDKGSLVGHSQFLDYIRIDAAKDGGWATICQNMGWWCANEGGLED